MDSVQKHNIYAKYIIFERGRNIYFSAYPPPTLIHLSHRFSSASKPAVYKSFDCCLSHFRTSVSTFSSSLKCLPRFSTQLGTALRDKHFHRKQETFLYEYHLISLFAHKNAKTTLLFDITLLKHGRHFDYRNQPLNMSMRVCYLDSHEAELCFYLVIHTENPLHPLQLFYFHLLSIF
jgi:hypothetical protein